MAANRDDNDVLNEALDTHNEITNLLYRKAKLMLDRNPSDGEDQAAQDQAINASLMNAAKRFGDIFKNA